MPSDNQTTTQSPRGGIVEQPAAASGHDGTTGAGACRPHDAPMQPMPTVGCNLITGRKPCCSVGYGGNYKIIGDAFGPECRNPYHLTWLPKGYGPSYDQYCIGLIREPIGENWDSIGLGQAPLLAAICQVIEAHMARPLSERQAEIDVLAAKRKVECENEQC